MTPTSVFTDESIVVVFTYAPAGLGHLRVTEALHEGLPNTVTPLLLGSHDQSISAIHRLTSVNPFGRKFMELGQKGIGEDLFTAAYRAFLRSDTKLLYEQISTILDQRIHLPNTILVIATHFGLAHQLSIIKAKLAKEKKVRIFLIVVVTDDSPQHIWYVPGSDLTVVPSQRTKEQLARFGRVSRLTQTKLVVIPYPVSPALASPISKHAFKNRRSQLDPLGQTPVQIAVPISGAAVGTDFMHDVIMHLRQLSNHFEFRVICRLSTFTKNFIDDLAATPGVKLLVSEHYREIINFYELMYQKNVISLEITKPSEQAFKALLSPKQVGGALLLFSNPVGRQEYDNLYFLRRHHLVPSESENETLWQASLKNPDANSKLGQKLRRELRAWRALRLPNSASAAAQFIQWCLLQGIFSQMAKWQLIKKNIAHHPGELGSDGVKRFWAEVEKFVRIRCVI